MADRRPSGELSGIPVENRGEGDPLICNAQVAGVSRDDDNTAPPGDLGVASGIIALLWRG